MSFRSAIAVTDVIAREGQSRINDLEENGKHIGPNLFGGQASTFKLYSITCHSQLACVSSCTVGEEFAGPNKTGQGSQRFPRILQNQNISHGKKPFEERFCRTPSSFSGPANSFPILVTTWRI